MPLRAQYRVQTVTRKRQVKTKRGGLSRTTSAPEITFQASVEAQTGEWKQQRPGSKASAAILLVLDLPTDAATDILPGDLLELATAVGGGTTYFVDFEDGPFKRSRQIYATDIFEGANRAAE